MKKKRTVVQNYKKETVSVRGTSRGTIAVGVMRSYCSAVVRLPKKKAREVAIAILVACEQEKP